MTLHLIKLSVGSESIASLSAWQAQHRSKDGVSWHGTRMQPKRKDELLKGGSIYWVIQGLIQARQELRDIHAVVREDGTKGARILFSSVLVPVVLRPCRSFQGWRYLSPEDAPPDLASASSSPDSPDSPDSPNTKPAQQPDPQTLRELQKLGLL